VPGTHYFSKDVNEMGKKKPRGQAKAAVARESARNQQQTVFNFYKTLGPASRSFS
jgi:hypothetical protein